MTMPTPSSPKSFSYRPYLDGMRAWAVMAVFVFHAARPGLPGGFVGVDLFFVLSGYLITTLLMIEHEENGSISFSAFYARRMRRLTPAIALLVTAVAIREAVWGSALDLGTRVREVWATLFYYANWNLIAQSDEYFLEGTGASPLRHAWSLAIEEQFYIIWPLLLGLLIVLLGRRKWGLTWTIALGALASAFVMAFVFDPSLVSRAYYGTDARIHQPLLGALLAVVIRKRGHLPVRWAYSVLIPSATVLVLAAFGLDGQDPRYYLGGSTLVALAAAGLIVSLEVLPGSWVTRPFTWKPVVSLGVISYGVYLWHWPVVLWITAPVGASFFERRLVNGVQFAVTVAVSIASYRLLEEPIRRGGLLRARKPLVTIGAGIAVLSLAAATSVSVVQPSGDGLVAEALADRSFEPCPNDPLPCLKVEGETGAPTVALVGDSTAQSYDPTLKTLARQYGFSYVQAAVGGCPIGHRLLATGTDGELHKASNLLCFENMPAVYKRLLDDWDPVLILATSANEISPHVTDGSVLPTGSAEHLEQTRTALEDAVDILTSQGAELVFIDILPPGPHVDCVDRGRADGAQCERRIAADSPELPYNALFRSIAEEREGVKSITLTDMVCGPTACPLIRNGMLTRYDGRHLTGTASRWLAPTLEERLRAVGVSLAELGG